MITEDRVRVLWEEVKRRIKAVDINRPLWRALDAAVPIALDGRDLVVGFDPNDEHESHFLRSPQNQPVVQEVLQAVATKPLSLVIVDGTTVADYDEYRQRETFSIAINRKTAPPGPLPIVRDTPQRPVAAEPAAAEEPVSVADSVTATDINRFLLQVNREFHMKYMALANRSLPLPRAIFLRECLGELLKVEDKVRTMEANPELIDRHMGKALDRVADIAGADAVVVSLEYDRLRREQI